MSVSKSFGTAFAATLFVFTAVASVDAGETRVEIYDHYRPDCKVVAEMVGPGSTDTTPLPATAPGHNQPPSRLVTQPPKILEVPCVEASQELEAAVNFALDEIGSVVMRTDKFEMELPVTSWNRKSVRFVLPPFGMLKCTHVSIHIYRPDGYLVRQFTAKLVRSRSIIKVVRTVTPVTTTRDTMELN